ncbi:MAG: 50S ribosomal protein L11 methyltransferase [Verrucomicrobiota bacterium]
MESLFRWSKNVDEEHLESWEARLIMDEVPHSAEKQIHRRRWQLSSYTSTRDEAEVLKSRYGGGVTEVRPEDWQPTSETGAETRIKIRDRLLVTEANDEETLGQLREEFPARIVLSFPPQLAFGTGGHPTTSGCLRFLVDVAKRKDRQEWSLLDLGCGSGILAVAAALLGAKRVVAVELDPMALKYARLNAERHGLEERIEFLDADAIALIDEVRLGRFDVVAANLFSELLMQLFPSLPHNLEDQGEVIVSGFLTSQTRAISDAARSSGIPLDNFLRRGKWVAAQGGGYDLRR